MQTYWYALSPRNQLLVGRGAVIGGYIDASAVIGSLRKLVDRYYSPESGVPIEGFGYPFISAAAGKQIPTDHQLKPIRNLAKAL